MKKCIALAALCIAAFATVPVASASAATGACTIKGKATINPALGATPKNANFKFESKSGEGSCTVGAYEGSEVHGKGELSCAVSQNVAGISGTVEGSGSITIGGKTDPFSFTLVGATGGVLFSVTGEHVKAAGAAEFFTSLGSLKECGEFHGENLLFEAATAGEFT
jgi:hypothetical protein